MAYNRSTADSEPVKPVYDVSYATLEEIIFGKSVAKQAIADAEELHVREREMREGLEKQIQALEDKKALLEAQYQNSNSEFLATLSEADQWAETIEGQLRASMVAYYNENPDSKQLGEGLSIRLSKKYEYDERQAVDYAIDHKMDGILKIDATAFKKLMSVQKADFVTVTEEPSAVISFK